MLHSVIEDTGLVSLMGANIFITLLLRCILTLLCVYLILKIFSNYSEDFWKKYLVNENIPKQSYGNISWLFQSKIFPLSFLVLVSITL